MAAKGRKFKLDRYIELIRRVPLVPIESEATLDRAIAFMDELLDKDRSVEEGLYLDVLATLVEQYEDVACPEEPVDDATLPAELLSAREMTQAMLARKASMAESTISEVLGGSRKLTRAQIGRICAVFNVPADIFTFEG